MLRSLRPLAFLVISFLATPSSAITFADGTFDPADWTLILSGDGTVTAGQVVSGGNPGAYREVNDLPDVGLSVAGFHLQSSFVWDPSVSGAIDQVDWSIDFLNVASGQFVALAMQQAGANRAAGGFVTTNFRGSWFTMGDVGLTEADFAGADFSASGSPITFGFLTANTWDPAAGSIDNIVAYDNLSITVHPVPEPVVLILLIAGALCVRRAARPLG